MARPDRSPALDEFPEDSPPPLTAAEHPHVEEVPDRGGGYPVVRNTGIPVWVVVSIHRQGRNLADTVEYFGSLTPEQVAGALDYYVRFPARVEEDFERNKRVWVELTGQPWPV